MSGDRDEAGGARPAGSRPRRPLWIVGGAAAAVVILAAGVAAIALSGSGESGATPGPSHVAAASGPAGTPGSPGPSGPPPSAGASLATGGKVATAFVAALHANPFVAHVEESVLSSSLTNGTRITLTAKASGDVAGRDVSIDSSTTGGGPATEQHFVSVGDVAWFRSKGDLGWTAAPRASVATSIDQLLATIAVVDDPGLLVDTGVETLDGQSVHHLTAAGGVPFKLPSGVAGDYATFDAWATAAGVPVLVKATFVEVQGVNSLTGGVDIRYSKVGGPIAISPPAGAPTLAP